MSLYDDDLFAACSLGDAGKNPFLSPMTMRKKHVPTLTNGHADIRTPMSPQTTQEPHSGCTETLRTPLAYEGAEWTRDNRLILTFTTRIIGSPTTQRRRGQARYFKSSKPTLDSSADE